MPERDKDLQSNIDTTRIQHGQRKIRTVGFRPSGARCLEPDVTSLGSRSIGAQQPGACTGRLERISLLTERRVFEGVICCYRHVAPMERSCSFKLHLKLESASRFR